MLYLIATPIGNLGDISKRALDTIEACDYLLCEDTRHSRKLLNAYDLKTSLKSYHKFNEARREQSVIADLKRGVTVGLVSDAGTPTISDPGARLIAKCHDENISVVPLPGPCAAITALCASGLPTARFQFLGFLPKKKGKLTTLLKDALHYPGTTVCYESPYRIQATLTLLDELAPERTVVVARELTKKFETIRRGFPGQLASCSFKGEIVLML